MKRSKVFLGLTTGVLAIAGVTAAKHYGPTRTRFYVTTLGTYCKDVPSLCTKAVGGIQCYFTVGSGSDVKRYPLYTIGPSGVWSSTNCKTPLLYGVEH
jgi:hypothetical protein